MSPPCLRRRTVPVAALAVAALTALTACGGSEPASAPTTSATSSASPTPTTSTASPSEATPPEASPAAAQGVAVLLDDGIGLVDPGTGSIAEAALDGPVEPALRVGAAAFGAEAVLEPQGCGVDDREAHTWPEGLIVYARDGVFIGWTVRPDSPAAPTLTTLAGIGLGSTLAELQEAYAVEVTATTLGEEFSVGSLTGVLDGDGPTSQVVALWGGDGCVAR